MTPVESVLLVFWINEHNWWVKKQKGFGVTSSFFGLFFFLLISWIVTKPFNVKLNKQTNKIKKNKQK